MNCFVYSNTEILIQHTHTIKFLQCPYAITPSGKAEKLEHTRPKSTSEPTLRSRTEWNCPKSGTMEQRKPSLTPGSITWNSCSEKSSKHRKTKGNAMSETSNYTHAMAFPETQQKGRSAVPGNNCTVATGLQDEMIPFLA